jgi:fructose/tagatose bisphosphate aldolase
VPIYIHFDHFSNRKDIDSVFNMIGSTPLPMGEHGVDSIMVDGSHLSFEENMKFTQEMVCVLVSLSFTV